MTSRRPGSLASGWGTGTSALGRFAHGCARALSMTGVLAPFILPMPLQGATKVELPLTSKWGQEPPYNANCPSPGESVGSTYAGPVATAMAQVMYYWRWPNTGVGSASKSYNYRWEPLAAPVSTPLASDPGVPPGWQGGRLSWSAGRLFMAWYWDDSILKMARLIALDPNYRTALQQLYGDLAGFQTNLVADFGATTYRWDLMRDENDLPIDSAGMEVARLIFHAGMAADMQYGLLESATPNSNVPNALTGHFRYDPDATWESLDPDKIVEELQWMRPVIVSGDSLGFLSRQTWVIYGYNQETTPCQFKMSLGWAGGFDGWYSIDQVPQGFNLNQDQVTRIAPLAAVRFVGANASGDGSPDSPFQDIEEALAGVADGATLVFKAGSSNTFVAAPLVINKPLTLKGYQVTIAK